MKDITEQMMEFFGADNVHVIEGPVPDLSDVYVDVRFTTNPCNSAEFVPDRQALLDACGFIPVWVQEWLDDEDVDEEDLSTYLAQRYGHPCFEYPMEGTVQEDGRYTYPSDPDLYPLMSVYVGEERLLYMYQYGIVAVPVGDSHVIVRMD